MQVRTAKQRAADATATLTLEHRDAELGMPLGARQVCDAEEMQLIVRNGEHRVLREIDALHVLAHCMVAEGRAEAQPAIVRPELQEMLDQRGPLGARKLSDGNSHLAPGWTG